MAGKIRNITILGLTLCLLLLSYVPVAAAQTPEFRLDADSLNLREKASANFVVSLINAQGAQIINIDGLEDFELLSQSRSTSTSIINGQTTYREDIYYTVMPKKTGQYELKVNFQYNGQSYESNTLQINVSEASDTSGKTTQDLFIETIVSHADAYLGEKLVITYNLYTRYNIDTYGFTDYIAIDGAVSKDIPENQLSAEYVYLDGERYVKYEVKQLIAEPIKTGTFVIPSFNFQVNVVTENSMGGGFSGLFRSTTPVYLQTDGAELTIKPLPTEGKPADFSGIVGELRLDGQYSRESLNYGDSFSLQVTASGSFNPDGLKNILTGEITGFSVYETQKNASEYVQNNQYYAEKSFEVIFVPEKTGKLDVSPGSISYFNPVSGKYERAEIPGADIEVLGEIPVSAGVTDVSYGNVETVTIDQVSYADTNSDYLTLQFKKDLLYTVLIGFLALVALAAGLIFTLSRRKKQDPTLKVMYKRLMGAKDVNEIYNLFNDMIKYCCNLSLKACSQNVVRNSFKNPDLGARIAEIMDNMESAKFSDNNGSVNLKEKISGVYSMLQRTVLAEIGNSKHVQRRD